jgi:hypothetical protein
MVDEEQYFLSIYFYEAIQTVAANALKKKGTKTVEYRKQTIFDELEERRRIENPTEEEKQKYIDELFGRLGQMQTAFEKNHPPSAS